MGAQPATLQGGLVAATASTDTQPPSSTISPPTAVQRPERPADHDQRHRHRRHGGDRRRPGRRRRGLDRRRHHLAPRAGARHLDLLLDPGRHRDRHDQGARDRRQRQPREPGRPGHRQRHRADLPLLDLGRLVHRTPARTTPNAVEVGVKFRSDQSGFITGLRFYKNAGQHRHPRRPPVDGGRHPARRGDLHRRERLRLAGSALARPGGDRRQHDLHRLLPRARRPLRREPRTTSPRGFDSAPLHALADGVDGGTASTSTGPPGGFPADTFNASNYWVDVVFRTGRPGQRPPTINSRSPASGATGVATGADVTATFNEPMNPTTINRHGRSCAIRRTPWSRRRSATAPRNGGRRCTRAARLLNSTTYTATVKGGAGGVNDVAGNPLAADSTWSFTTPARRRRRRTRARAARSW